jgi:cell division protein FtsB
MTQSTANTVPAGSGNKGASGERRSSPSARERSSQAARRRWLILLGVVLVVVVAVLVNLPPLTHYQDASARLRQATAKVSTLKAQKTAQQGQMAKLRETAYLETLAREQLAYVRPGEELYIVTDSAGDAGAGAAGVASDPGSSAVQQGGTTSSVPPADTGTEPAESPGVLERLLSTIRALF